MAVSASGPAAGEVPLFDINGLDLGSVGAGHTSTTGMPHVLPGKRGEQLGLDGIEPTTAPNPNLAKLQNKSALVSAMFPGYWGIDPEVFTLVTEDAFMQSDPRQLEPKLYKHSPLSLRSPDSQAGWVLFPADEHARVIDYPEAYASRTDGRNRTQLPALLRTDQVERNDVAARAGAHALERPLVKMETLMAEYATEIDVLRALAKLVPYEFQARGLHIDNRAKLDVFRNRLHIVMQNLADVKDWTTEDLRLAKLGVDMRLLAGHGRVRLQEKKRDWSELIKVVGNHAVAKKVVVRDRALRSQLQIDKRLSQHRAS